MGRFSAFVLAAGFGTRLRPLTDEIPKPLLPVGPEPLLLSTLRVLHEAGAAALGVNVHHHAEKITNEIKRLSFNVHVSRELRILGTAGGLAAVRGRFAPPVVLVNGDIVTTLPIAQLLSAQGPGLTLAVTAPSFGSVGSVGLDATGRVARLRGEVFSEEVRAADYIGVACLGAECWATLPSEGCLIGDWALPWLRQGRVIDTVWSAAPYRDLGTPASYLEANLEWLGARSYVAPGAELAPRLELEQSVVGAGARVLGLGPIRQSVILPGATAQGPLQRCIVLPSGRRIEVP
jgi:mannose-1-phosphate guanylyltransferase